jgi:hypothetical protein
MIADLLQTRARAGQSQLIVTTHSPLLADTLPADTLFVCRKLDDGTEIAPFGTWGPLGKEADIGQALAESMSPSERILRGDFDA